ncbi:MAG TPA: pirin family protein [Vicinamibacteria bacterium]|nr:pirin family protein [Vicinamibacteria bacterium]
MTHREVMQIVTAQEALEGAGVRIRRSLGTPALDYHDPFLLLDEFHSEDGADYVAGFPDHPHRGFETVTYMLAGRMRHEDHTGARGELGPGSVQWMTAGRGIIHSEMPLQEQGLMWGFQLWVNLPARDKMTAPRYQDIPAERIPEITRVDGSRIRVVAGAVEGVVGPVSGIATSPLYLDIVVPAKTSVVQPVPSAHNAFLYVFEGEGVVGGKRVERGQLAVLSRGSSDTVELVASGQPLRALLVAAKPLGEPVARYGPFVMNTREEIQRAFEDYRGGTFLS